MYYVILCHVIVMLYSNRSYMILMIILHHITSYLLCSPGPEEHRESGGSVAALLYTESPY